MPQHNTPVSQLMVSQNAPHSHSHSPSRRRRRKAAGQPKRRTQTPAPRVLCLHCGKTLSRSTAFRHELASRAAAAIAAANPLPQDYPFASPPSSPFRAHPSSENGRSISSFNSTELREEGLHRSHVNNNTLRNTFNNHSAGGDISTDLSDNISDLDNSISEDSDVDQANDDDNRSTHATHTNNDNPPDIEMQDGEDGAGGGGEDQGVWMGLGEADGFGVQDDGFAGDDDECDGATGEGNGLVDGDALQASIQEDEDEQDGIDVEQQGSQVDSDDDYEATSGTGTESTSEATDSDDFAVRRWSDEEDPQPQQPGTSRHLPPLQQISTNWEVVVGRDCKQITLSVNINGC